MVIATCSLTRPAGMRAGQQISAGNAQPAFQQFGLDAGERPRVGKPLAAVVAGEDDDGVVGQAIARPAPADTRPICRSIACTMRA